MSFKELTEMIKVARGEKLADHVIKGAKIVDVFSGEIIEGDIAMKGEWIAGIGDYEGVETTELDGGYLVPGLIDAHVHIESSMVSPPHYAAGVLPLGTTAVVADPHEIANVMGPKGVRLMLKLSRNLPLSVFIMVPSCVPATHMETSGAEIDAPEIGELLKEDGVIGLAEMMNYPGILFCDEGVLAKISVSRGRIIDGHAPGLSGKDLQCYIAAGIMSDHECTEPGEALEKLRAGMNIMIREGTGARNLDTLLPIVTPENSRRIMFASDDLHPPEILGRGHIDYMIRRAIEYGLDPITAIRIGSFNAASYFRLDHLGALGPGKMANILWIEDLDNFHPAMVWAKGKLVAKDGVLTPAAIREPAIAPPPTMNPASFDVDSFRIEADKGSRAHVIQIIPGQLITNHLIEEITVENDKAVSNIEKDILKMAVIERHRATGNIGLGFVSGFGLKKGAIAGSVAHDSHNLIVIGTSDEDIDAAAKAVVRIGGGFAVASEGKTLATLPLTLAGLMSLSSIEEVKSELDKMKAVTAELGCKIEDPFMMMGFMALPVIPKLKLTDKGLVDVEQFKIINLFE